MPNKVGAHRSRRWRVGLLTVSLLGSGLVPAAAEARVTGAVALTADRPINQLRFVTVPVGQPVELKATYGGSLAGLTLRIMKDETEETRPFKWVPATPAKCAATPCTLTVRRSVPSTVVYTAEVSDAAGTDKNARVIFIQWSAAGVPTTTQLPSFKGRWAVSLFGGWLSPYVGDPSGSMCVRETPVSGDVVQRTGEYDLMAQSGRFTGTLATIGNPNVNRQLFGWNAEVTPGLTPSPPGDYGGQFHFVAGWGADGKPLLFGSYSMRSSSGITDGKLQATYAGAC